MPSVIFLYGGFGTPEDGFILVWKNSDLSREQRCHPAWREHVKMQIEQARQNVGATVFDWLIDIIKDEDREGVELRLE